MDSNILILGLHRIGLPPKSAKIRGLFTTPRLLSFEVWLLLKLGYRFTTLQNAVVGKGEKVAVLTFDDGYADTYTAALPILERYRIPATIFVLTEDVGKKNVVWDESDEKVPANMADWKMLQKLLQAGWEIGSHSHRHVHHATKSEKQQEWLVRRSAEEIENRLGIVPLSFSYPYGTYDSRTKAILWKAGFRFAVTGGEPNAADSEPIDLLELKRVRVGGRYFFHYIKVIIRTIKAIGIGQVLRAAAGPVRHCGLSRKPAVAAYVESRGPQNKT